MSIRVQCEKCASVLKIKEELAGTMGKCPKCKTPFRVPEPGESETTVPQSAADETTRAAGQKPPASSKPVKASAHRELPAAEATEEPPPSSTDPELPVAAPAPAAESSKPAEAAKPAAKPAAAGGDDFDPVAFLMADGGAKPKAAPPPPPPPAPPTGGKRPWSLPKTPAGKPLELDDDTEVPANAETVTPPPRGRSAADSATAALSGNPTSSSAKDLLARTAQDSRARASQMPDEDRGPRVDYGAAFREIGKAFGPHIAGTIILCLGLYYFMDRMFADDIPLPKLAPVSGQVTLDGKPLSEVVVRFKLLGSKEEAFGTKEAKEDVRVAEAMTDAEGRYVLMYLPEERVRGAVVGKNRVSIEPTKLEDYKRIPAHLQNPATSNLIEDVKETGGEINFNF
jgi:hypothetical protein